MAERRSHPALGLTVLLVVLGVTLAFGSGLGSGAPPTQAQRAAAIEANLRCPSCEDVSVAQSSASSALAVRRQVTSLLGAGESDQQIQQTLVGQYGPSILLRPPATGLSALVWVIPAAAGAVAVGALGLVFWRRSRELQRLREGP